MTYLELSEHYIIIKMERDELKDDIKEDNKYDFERLNYYFERLTELVSDPWGNGKVDPNTFELRQSALARAIVEKCFDTASKIRERNKI